MVTFSGLGSNRECWKRGCSMRVDGVGLSVLSDRWSRAVRVFGVLLNIGYWSSWRTLSSGDYSNTSLCCVLVILKKFVMFFALFIIYCPTSGRECDVEKPSRHVGILWQSVLRVKKVKVDNHDSCVFLFVLIVLKCLFHCYFIHWLSEIMLFPITTPPFLPQQSWGGGKIQASDLRKVCTYIKQQMYR